MQGLEGFEGFGVRASGFRVSSVGFRQDVWYACACGVEAGPINPTALIGMLARAPDVMHLTVDLRCPSDDAAVIFGDLNKTLTSEVLI